MLVKSMGGGVFGVNEHGEYAQLGPRDAEHGITQEHAAESSALIVPGHCTPPHQGGRHYRAAGQFPDDVGSQRVQRNAGRCQRIESGHFFGLTFTATKHHARVKEEPKEIAEPPLSPGAACFTPPISIRVG